MTGFGNACLKRTVIRQQEQAFAVGIQPTRHPIFGQLQVIRQALPAALGRELGDYSVGFVKSNEWHSKLSISDHHKKAPLMKHRRAFGLC
jgi:hypothetical protein